MKERNGRRRSGAGLCKASGVLKDLLIYGGDASVKRRDAILEGWLEGGGLEGEGR